MFRVGDFYEIRRENGNNQTETKRYQIQKLDDQLDCIGLLTETEVIVLTCPKRERNGCFDVTRRSHLLNNEISGQDGEVIFIAIRALSNNKQLFNFNIISFLGRKRVSPSFGFGLCRNYNAK